MAAHGTTRANAIREGRKLLQTYGYNGFSFQNLADKLGLTKPSLFVHFKSKEDFALELLADYRRTTQEWRETLKDFEPDQQLRAWFDRFYQFACEGAQYCAVNAFASDFNSLAEPVQEAVNRIGDERRKWVEGLIAEGQKKKIFRKDMTTKSLTELTIALSFGAQQMARLSGNPERIKSIKKEVMALLTGKD